jgi:hypothetical protein
MGHLWPPPPPQPLLPPLPELQLLPPLLGREKELNMLVQLISVVATVIRIA